MRAGHVTQGLLLAAQWALGGPPSPAPGGRSARNTLCVYSTRERPLFSALINRVVRLLARVRAHYTAIIKCFLSVNARLALGVGALFPPAERQE
jgi:hypothetical protein